ncbi:MAG: TIGR04552 family protein [Polyangiales bacterium]
MSPSSGPQRVKPIAEWSLADLESVRLLLRGDSIIDWHRLNFDGEREAHEFLACNELFLDKTGDIARCERVKTEAVDYLRRHFEFPIPKQIERQGIVELMMTASGRGHKQLCACTILKCMHIIHHLEGRELLFMLPLSDQEVFHLVEEKVYRVVGGMLAAGMPITEFIGGRKNKFSLYTKLLSKDRNIASQIYDKLRFRIVTRDRGDILPVLHYLTRKLFAWNYAIPRESTNTIFQLKRHFQADPNLSRLVDSPNINGEEADELTPSNNSFSDESFRIIHFVVDLPIRLPDRVIEDAPPAAKPLGPVIFALTEFQIIDRETESANEVGDASHERYKERQRLAVMRRLKLGARGDRISPTPPPVESEPREKEKARR